MENAGFDGDKDAGGLPEKGGAPVETSIDVSVGASDEKAAPADKPYAGMGKEDLLRFSQTPFWNRLRTVSLIIFWLGWAGLLAAVVVLTVVAPRCAAPPQQSWYDKSVVYQVFVRSFYDSDGDGVGDIKGVTSKLDYIKSLNAEVVSLSAFYPSHWQADGSGDSDFGYDVIDHVDVDPVYGDLADVDELIKAAHDEDMKVVIDFIPNHTGDQHPWFTESNSATPGLKEQYYVWRACTGGTTDWKNIYDPTDGSAWTDGGGSRPNNDDCYLHQLLDSQPDLNLRNPLVLAELETILRFWLDRGVDGFRVVNAQYLVEDSLFRAEADCDADGQPPKCRTESLPETYNLINQWRALLNEYSSETEKVLIVESQGVNVNDTARYYGLVAGAGAHLPVNFQLAGVGAATTGAFVRDLIEEFMSAKPEFGAADWLIGYQDNRRKAAEVGDDMSAALALLSMTLPGTAFIYYGDELGMTEGVTTFDAFNSSDPTGLARDRYRTPMQWTETGGFVNGTGEPWIPVNDDANIKNVETLEANSTSLLNIYRSLADLHRTDTGFQYGDLEFGLVDAEIVSYIRRYDGTNRYLVAANVGAAERTANLRVSGLDIPESAELVVATRSAPLGGRRKVGDSVNLRSVIFAAGEAAVFKWSYSR